MQIQLRARAVALALVLALGVAACGGDGGSPEESADRPAPAADTAGVGTAGDTLSLGDRAVVDFVDYGSTDTKQTKVGVSVIRVREGRISDFGDFNLKSRERTSMPYYVDAKFENLGQRQLTRHLLVPSIEDGHGQEHRPVNLIVLSGTFKPCPDYSKAKLGSGESFTGCSAILLPKDERLERVRFQGDVTEDPVFWGTE